MYVTSLIAATFAAIATAAPTRAVSKKTYIAVSLFFHINPPHSFNYEEPAPITLYHFYNFHQAKNVKKVNFDGREHFNIPVNSVECQFYADALGQEPLGSFTVDRPLVFDKPRTIGSGLCYARANETST